MLTQSSNSSIQPVSNTQSQFFTNTQSTESNFMTQSESSGNDANPISNVSNFNPVQLTQLFKPNLMPTKIDMDASGLSQKEKREIAKGLGSAPFVYYNGIHIEYSDISNFELYHEGILPAMKMTFKDRNGIFKDVGFPLDDTIVSIFLYSRSKILRSINMDFKITSFKDLGDGQYTTSCIINVSELFLKKFKSYSNMSSFEAMQGIAKDCNLGFCSNITSTNDTMTWISTGIPKYEFINNVLLNSYLSDSAFLTCYIDFYYNICYLDVEKELERDSSNDQMIQASGQSDFTDNQDDDEQPVPLLLTTDKSMKSSNSYISAYTINNNSTKVSLNKSYYIKTKSYDSINKEFLGFDVDSITSKGDKTIILKAKSEDENFFQNNYDNIWLGKLDKYNNGSGNAHANYNYSLIQNKVNLDELSKISIEITLPNPNFNLYINEKVFLALINEKPGINHKNITYLRLTGNWLTSSINYIFDGKNFYQKITLNKRELELHESEYETMPKSKPIKGNNEDNTNPSDYKNPPIPTTATQSNQQTTSSKSVGDQADKNVQAFLLVVRQGEGTPGPGGYTTIFGGKHFSSFADHPRIKVPFGNSYSDAAGAYQFLSTTWDPIRKHLKLPDFSPDSQDKAAIYYISSVGAIDYIKKGNIPKALDICSNIWASLPTSKGVGRYGQPNQTLAQVNSSFTALGGVEQQNQYSA